MISGPAGYAKSTLASRWGEACEVPSGWVFLDESDRDLRTFLSYVLAAIRSLLPKMELLTEALLEASPLPPIPILARHVLNDLHKIAEPVILVLDDYHFIQEILVHDLPTEILAHPPQAMHLASLTRRDPALPISRLRGRGQLTEIRAAELCFACVAFLARSAFKAYSYVCNSWWRLLKTVRFARCCLRDISADFSRLSQRGGEDTCQDQVNSC